jgi:hypothetical protein
LLDVALRHTRRLWCNRRRKVGPRTRSAAASPSKSPTSSSRRLRCVTCRTPRCDGAWRRMVTSGRANAFNCGRMNGRRTPIARSSCQKEGGAPKGAATDLRCRIFYRDLRRRWPSQPKPTSALPSKVSDAGSGTVTLGRSSPDENAAVSGPVTVPAARAVRESESGRSTVKSVVLVPPTGKSASNAALAMVSEITLYVGCRQTAAYLCRL